MIARDRALLLRAVTPDPLALADLLGVRVVLFPLPLWLREMYLPAHGVAVINARLSGPSRRWYVVHTLGHHQLHAGDQGFLRAHCFGVVAKQEAQAERFAGYFLCPILTPEALAALPSDKRLYRIELERVCAPLAA